MAPVTYMWDKDINTIPELQSESFLQAILECKKQFEADLFSFRVPPRRQVVECRIQDDERRLRCLIEYDNHTKLFKIVECNIPVNVKPDSVLEDLVIAFWNEYKNLSSYFEAIDMVESTYRCEQTHSPEQKYNYNTRSILLGSGIKFEVSFSLSGHCNKMQVFCHDGDMRSMFEQKLNDWDDQLPFVVNVNNIFGEDILKFGTVEKNTTCKICFGNWADDDMLNERAVMVQCLVSNCYAAFHWKCIRSWFLVRHLYIEMDIIIGNCPCCDSPLSILREQAVPDVAPAKPKAPY